MRKFPAHPGHPERICWGCEHLCPADDMRCGNGTERAQHPIELWGEDWMSIGGEQASAQPADAAQPPELAPGSPSSEDPGRSDPAGLPPPPRNP